MILKKVILYFLIVTAVLFGLRVMHYRGLLKTKGYYQKYETAFCGSQKYEVVFLGSSRAEMAYDTGLYDTLTGKRSFNLGTAGATPRLAYTLLATYLESHPAPELIYYEIDFHALKKEGTQIKNFNNFFPFLKLKNLRQRFNLIDPRMEHFYYNPYYSWPYTGFKNLSTSLHGWLNLPTQNEGFYHEGFLREISRPALKPSGTGKFYVYFNFTERLFLDSLIIKAKDSGAKIRLVCSPSFKGGRQQIINQKQVLDQIRNIAILHELDFFDLSEPEMAGRPINFVDPYHLNARGAREFTGLLVAAEGNKTIGLTLK